MEEGRFVFYLEGSREVGAKAQAALNVLHKGGTSAKRTIKLRHRLMSHSDPGSDFIKRNRCTLN